MQRFWIVAMLALSPEVATADETVVAGSAPSTRAPHLKGNVYAPEIIRWQGSLLMFFGGQGEDGHDRIHLAISADGKKWRQRGVVFAPRGVNHVNDPSVVNKDGRLHLFYTLAREGVTDSIGLAISEDGIQWQDLGAVFSPGSSPGWDSLSVGRPSVIYDGTQFRMWYDGRKDLPPDAPDIGAPKSATSQRYVGYATSQDGKSWVRHREPVFAEDAGGVQVVMIKGRLVMVIESREGTKWATSDDGIVWAAKGLLCPKSESVSPFGHVTPFLYLEGGECRLYYGAAASQAWDQNSIHSVDLPSPGE